MRRSRYRDRDLLLSDWIAAGSVEIASHSPFALSASHVRPCTLCGVSGESFTPWKFNFGLSFCCAHFWSFFAAVLLVGSSSRCFLGWYICRELLLCKYNSVHAVITRWRFGRSRRWQRFWAKCQLLVRPRVTNSKFRSDVPHYNLHDEREERHLATWFDIRPTEWHEHHLWCTSHACSGPCTSAS